MLVIVHHSATGDDLLTELAKLQTGTRISLTIVVNLHISNSLGLISYNRKKIRQIVASCYLFRNYKYEQTVLDDRV